MTDVDILLSKDEKLTNRTIGGLTVQPVTDNADYFNMLIYGDPGVGKTILAGSASAVEAMNPVLFIDVEGGTLSLRNTYPDVDVVRVRDFDQMQDVYDEIYRGDSGYKTVVLDSLTEIQKFSMYGIMDDLIKREPDRDPDVPGMREWGKNIEQIRLFVRAWRDLPINTIFTALALKDKDPKTGVPLTRPSLTGKVGWEVLGLVDIVLYMYMKRHDDELKRFLLSGKTDKEEAKDRSGRLPLTVESPTMQTLHTLITGRTK